MSRTAPGVPRVLVRLKLRLLINRARSTKGGRWALATGALTTSVLAVLGFTVAFGLGRSGDIRVERTTAVLGGTALLIAWAVLPLVTFGSDESLDPSRLVTFPLRRGPLMRGLLGASLIGFAPAVAVASVAGLVAAHAGGAGLVVGVPAMVLLLLLCAAAGRTLSTFLAAGLTSRRGRDAAVVVVSVLLLATQAVRFIRFSSIDPKVFDRLDDVLRWFPPGMLGQAVIDGRNGHVLVALAQLVPAAVSVVVLLILWERALDRSLTVVTDGATPRRQRHVTGLPLMFRRLAFVPPVPWGAVTAKELRYFVREPRRKVNLINSVLIGVALPIVLAARSSGSFRTQSVLLASIAGYIVVLGAMNQFGPDGGALWLDVVAGDRVRAELVGKNVALLLFVAPMVVAVGTVAAVLTGGWPYLPAALLLAIAGLGAGLGVANVVSVRFPVRLPDTRSPFGGLGGGQGCGTVLMLLGCALAQNLLIAPVVLAAVITTAIAPALLFVVAPICALYGATLWWIGVVVATDWARQHQPELLRAVDPTRSD